MKKSYLIAATLISLILSACTSTSTPTAIPTVSLDNNGSSPGKQSSEANSVSASAIIVPLNDVQLSFSSVGRVTSVDVKVGDKVTAGQTLVTLDTTILDAKVREAEANVLAADAQIRYLNRLATDALHFESAQADLARAQALLDSAKATLLAQSTLTAPFDGTLTQLKVEKGQQVADGELLAVISHNL